MRTSSQRIADALQKRFPNNTIAPKHYGELLVAYQESGLAAPHILTEIETQDEGKFWSAVWEAMLFAHFQNLGFKLTNRSRSSGQNGPDFCLQFHGKTVWIEAVVPSPEGIPAEYIAPPIPGEIRVGSKPDRERVLRCTAVITDKKNKFAEYVRKGIVRADDCTVIALNICRLSDWDFDGAGISQLPLAMEAVFPVGPLAVAITSEGTLADEAQHSVRFSVKKNSGVDIQTYNFLDPDFGGISAILQGYQKDTFNRPLILSEIHNPLAKCKLPLRIFGCSMEFVAEENGDDYKVRNIVEISRTDVQP
jgi:type I restriction enzyme S subunit